VRRIITNKLVVVLFVITSLSLVALISLNTSTKSQNNGDYDHSKVTAIFHDKEFQVPAEITRPYPGYADSSITDTTSYTNVLGAKSKEKKRIEIDLSAQKLYAYEGNEKKMSFKVSTGKWGTTPTGEFRIWTKLKYTLMTGGSQESGTYYYLPNVPFTMYFHQGYGIHGTYWHDNFGHPMSHGCVNMKTEEAEKLFYWANPSLHQGTSSVLATEDNPGTRVIIYGTTPNE